MAFSFWKHQDLPHQFTQIRLVFPCPLFDLSHPFPFHVSCLLTIVFLDFIVFFSLPFHLQKLFPFLSSFLSLSPFLSSSQFLFLLSPLRLLQQPSAVVGALQHEDIEVCSMVGDTWHVNPQPHNQSQPHQKDDICIYFAVYLDCYLDYYLDYYLLYYLVYLVHLVSRPNYGKLTIVLIPSSFQQRSSMLSSTLCLIIIL